MKWIENWNLKSWMDPTILIKNYGSIFWDAEKLYLSFIACVFFGGRLPMGVLIDCFLVA